MAIDPMALKRSPLLSELSDKELRQLAASSRERSYEAGETILSEGSGGVGFFILVEGAGRIVIGDADRGTVGPGDWFGEVALLDDVQQRTATIVATEPTTCIAITAWDFRPFLADHPSVAWELLRSMARRMGNDRELARQQAG